MTRGNTLRQCWAFSTLNRLFPGSYKLVRPKKFVENEVIHPWNKLPIGYKRSQTSFLAYKSKRSLQKVLIIKFRYTENYLQFHCWNCQRYCNTFREKYSYLSWQLSKPFAKSCFFLWKFDIYMTIWPILLTHLNSTIASSLQLPNNESSSITQITKHVLKWGFPLASSFFTKHNTINSNKTNTK